MEKILISLGGFQTTTSVPDFCWDFVIAVDSGGDKLFALNIPANLVIGDLDSIGSESLEFHKKNGCKISTFPVDKDATDIDLALQSLSQNRNREIHLLNMWGGRFDHSIMNLLVLTKHLYSGLYTFDTPDGFGGVNGAGSLVLRVPRGLGNSLLALSPKVKDICSTGVNWPLDHETLEFGETRGVSNQIKDAPWRISFSSGALCWHISGLSRAKAEIEWLP
ncbi:thiamine diphosphokinase [bacterium]|nr:thiamine diphosphokinase [bacterium]